MSEASEDQKERTPSFQHESPYSEGFYGAAEYRGKAFFSRLKGSGLTDNQINEVLANIGVFMGPIGSVMADEPMWMGDDGYQAAMDWTLEFTAAAQQKLSEEGVEITPGNDYRSNRNTPHHKYHRKKL